MIRVTKGPLFAGDSLFGTVGCFTLCIFYLLPAAALYNFIGWWSLLAAAGIWIAVLLVIRLFAFKERNITDD
jgi:hypothetical protein